MLCFILLFVGCGKQNTSNAEIPTDFLYTIIVAINPQIKLYVDTNDTIMAVEFLNQDAIDAFSDIDFQNMSIEEGISKVVDVSIEKKYLTNEKDVSVTFDDVKDESVKQHEIAEKIDNAVTEVLTQKEIVANITITDEKKEILQNTSEQTTPEQTTPEVDDSGTACSRCNGTGECMGCHGGRDICPACNGSGYETCPMCDANGLDHG